MYSEKLFSYGTLRYESVQLATFGRKLEGKSDILAGFSLSKIKIKDENVVKKSGDSEHPIVQYTGNLNDEVPGIVFNVTKEELDKADAYEVEDYKRVQVKLDSGIKAWIYISAESVIRI